MTDSIQRDRFVTAGKTHKRYRTIIWTIAFATTILNLVWSAFTMPQPAFLLFALGNGTVFSFLCMIYPVRHVVDRYQVGRDL